MSKTKLCLICNTRRIDLDKVDRQEWKTTDEEKYTCLTCKSFMNYCNKIGEEITKSAEERKISLDVEFFFNHKGDIK